MAYISLEVEFYRSTFFFIYSNDQILLTITVKLASSPNSHH